MFDPKINKERIPINKYAMKTNILEKKVNFIAFSVVLDLKDENSENNNG